MPPQQESQQAENIRTDYEIRALHAELNALRSSVESLQKDRDRALLWGVLVLGGAVVGMGLWIFNFVILKKP